MRREQILAVVLIAVMILSGTLTTVSAKSSSDYIKVGLKYGSTAVSECVLESSKGFQIVNVTDDGPEDTLPLPAYTKVVATVENGAVVLRDTDGTLLVSDLGSTGAVMPMGYDDGDGIITGMGAKYRDGIMLTLNGGRMNVINYITMDHYLYGVIHAEMSQSSPLEALKAQSVAARSFTSLNKRAHKDYGFDVCTTTHCQVYKGFSNEYPKTTQAVDETRGQMLYSDGKVVPGYYYKNSGGHTQNSEDVWSSKEPYLRGVKDEHSPDYPWTVTMTFDEIKSKMDAANYSTGTIQSVAITARNSAGAVSELTVKGDKGTVTLKKESVRTVLGATQIKSTMFDMSNATVQSGSSGGVDEIYASNGSDLKKMDSSLYVISSEGSNKKVSKDGVTITSGSKTVSGGGGSGGTAGQSSSVVTGGKVVFSGKGYGHGVGMPQDSAIKMAENGSTYEQILKYYYTGIEIR